MTRISRGVAALLLLNAAVGHAQSQSDSQDLVPSNGPPSAITPNESALSDSIQQYLEAQLGGPDGLFKALTGGPRSPNQSLFVYVPAEAIEMGPLTYDKRAQPKVKSLTQGIENCNPKTSLHKQIQTSETIEEHASWSKTTSTESSQNHDVSVSLEVDMPFNAGNVQSSYSFSTTSSSSQTNENAGDTGKSSTLTIDTQLVARPMRAEYYRTEMVTLVGNASTFTASAKVNSSAPIQFYVHTVGYTPKLPGAAAGVQMIGALSNVPPPGQMAPAVNVELGNRALVSPSGAFAHYLVAAGQRHQELPFPFNIKSNPHADLQTVNLLQSTPSEYRLMWSPYDPAAGGCGAGIRLVMQTDGNAVWYCGTKGLTSTGTSVAKRNPCWYLTWRVWDQGDIGQLACYSRDVSGMTQQSADSFRTWSSKVNLAKYPVKNLQNFYQVTSRTLQTIAGVSSKEFDYTGRFDGTAVMSPRQFYCTYGYDMVADKSQPGKCNIKQPVDDDNLCAETRAFLAPYIQTHGTASLLD